MIAVRRWRVSMRMLPSPSRSSFFPPWPSSTTRTLTVHSGNPQSFPGCTVVRVAHPAASSAATTVTIVAFIDAFPWSAIAERLLDLGECARELRDLQRNAELARDLRRRKDAADLHAAAGPRF